MPKEWEIPGLPTLSPWEADDKAAFEEWQRRYLEFMNVVEPQLKPGAMVVYPDGSRYKVPWKPSRSYTCEDTCETWNVYVLRPEP
jgi:hypothetical protein